MFNSNPTAKIGKDAMLQQTQTMLETLALQLKAETRDVVDQFGLADGQLFLLFSLWRNGECKASDISVQLGITSGGVTGMTDKLVSMGLINRIRSEEDRRVVLLSMTEKGLEMMEQIRKARLDKLQKSLSELSEPELEQIIHALQILGSVWKPDPGDKCRG